MKYEFKRSNWTEFGLRWAGLIGILSVIIVVIGLFAWMLEVDNWLADVGKWGGIVILCIIGTLIAGAILFAFTNYFFIEPFRKEEPKNDSGGDGEGGTDEADPQLAEGIRDREGEA